MGGARVRRRLLIVAFPKKHVKIALNRKRNAESVVDADSNVAEVTQEQLPRCRQKKQKR